MNNQNENWIILNWTEQNSSIDFNIQIDFQNLEIVQMMLWKNLQTPGGSS